MEKVIVAIPTFNNLKFTKMCVTSIRENTTIPYELLIIDDCSTDGTVEWVKEQGINLIEHKDNFGICYTMNDMYDYAWEKDKNAILIIVQTDTLMYSRALDELVRGMVSTNYDCLGACEVNIQDFVKAFPRYSSLFLTKSCEECEDKHYATLVVDDFPQYKEYEVKIDKIFRVIDQYPIFTKMGTSALTLFAVRKSFKDKVGYFDANFFPLYYCDNDYLFRASNTLNVRMGGVASSWYFHFQAATMNELHVKKIINKHNELNAMYYTQKWGGMPREETYRTPFNAENKYKGISSEKNILSLLQNTANINIFNRDYEHGAIRMWKNAVREDGRVI